MIPIDDYIALSALLFTLGGLIAYKRRAREVGLLGGPDMDEGEKAQ